MLDFVNECTRCLVISIDNPRYAISEMEKLRIETWDNYKKLEIWENYARKLNKRLDTIERCRFYDRTEFWKNFQPERILI